MKQLRWPSYSFDLDEELRLLRKEEHDRLSRHEYVFWLADRAENARRAAKRRGA